MHYSIPDLADFAFILAFFVLPAVFSPETGVITVPEAGNIPWMTILVYVLLVTYICIRYHLARKHAHADAQADRTSRTKMRGALIFFSNTAAALFLLMATNFLTTTLATNISGSAPVPSVTATVKTTADKLILVLWTMLLAAFEEYTYRWLLPTRLRFFLAESRPADAYTTTRKVLCEAVIICLFALAHRYMSWWAVLNAFFAGSILRISFFTSGSLYPGLIAHILYNLTVFYDILIL